MSEKKNPRLVTEGWDWVKETGKLKFALPTVRQGDVQVMMMQAGGSFHNGRDCTREGGNPSIVILLFECCCNARHLDNTLPGVITLPGRVAR